MQGRLYSHPSASATLSQPSSVGCSDSMSLRAALSAQPQNVHIFAMPLHHKDGPYVAEKTRTSSSFPTNHCSSKGPACRELGRSPKRTELPRWPVFLSPRSSSRRHCYVHLHGAKGEERSKKINTITRKVNNNVIAEENAAERATFRLERRKAATRRTTTTGRGRKREKDIE